jgi:glyoxylase-like metal-dependent hydrolase (beta-lactamase superfamily II)
MALRIYAFHCGGDRAPKAVYDPLDHDAGTIVYGPYFFFLITHPEGNVLFDVGLHPKWKAQAGDGEAETFAIEMGQDDDVVSKLRLVGLGPDDISHVIVSHLHFDHAGGLQFFPEANIVVQRRELQFAFWPPAYQRGVYDRDDFDHPLHWIEVEGDYDLFGDGAIVATPTPGHTAGHQAAIVHLASGMHVLAGDASYLTEKMRQRRLPGVLWNPDEMISSWEKLEDLERRFGAKLIFTHDFDYATSKPVPPDAFFE